MLLRFLSTCTTRSQYFFLLDFFLYKLYFFLLFFFKKTITFSILHTQISLSSQKFIQPKRVHDQCFCKSNVICSYSNCPCGLNCWFYVAFGVQLFVVILLYQRYNWMTFYDGYIIVHTQTGIHTQAIVKSNHTDLGCWLNVLLANVKLSEKKR